MLDEATEELVERRLDHESGEAQSFYRKLPKPVRVGIEATGPEECARLLMKAVGKQCKAIAAKVD